MEALVGPKWWSGPWVHVGVCAGRRPLARVAQPRQLKGVRGHARAYAAERRLRPARAHSLCFTAERPGGGGCSAQARQAGYLTTGDEARALRADHETATAARGEGMGVGTSVGAARVEGAGVGTTQTRTGR